MQRGWSIELDTEYVVDVEPESDVALLCLWLPNDKRTMTYVLDMGVRRRAGRLSRGRGVSVKSETHELGMLRKLANLRPREVITVHPQHSSHETARSKVPRTPITVCRD